MSVNQIMKNAYVNSQKTSVKYPEAFYHLKFAVSYIMIVKHFSGNDQLERDLIFMNKSEISKYLKDNWNDIKENVRNEFYITDISYNTWIKPLEFSEFKDNTVYIIVPNDQSQAIRVIDKKYNTFFMVMISQMLETDEEIRVSFVLKKDINKEEKKVYNINYENANLNSKYRFDTFVVGNNNKLAHSAALAVAESPGDAYNPLYLYSGSGLGKTHLMHSIGHFILEHNPDIKVLYVPSETFTNDVIDSIRSGSTQRINEMRNKYRGVDVLMIDDIQYIIGKDSTQQEFFNTFNDLHSSGKQIILSSDKPPKELDTLEERFRTRFEWGLIADIQAPDYETRMAILKKNTERYGRKIEDPVFDYIASNITSNIRELEGALNKLIAYSRLNNVDISTDIMEEALKDIINPNKSNVITPMNIIRTVAEHFNIDYEDLISRSRKKELVVPRFICMYLCREMTDEPFQNIALSLNKKDHTTVMHGYEKISEDIKVDKELFNTVDVIRKKISPL